MVREVANLCWDEKNVAAFRELKYESSDDPHPTFIKIIIGVESWSPARSNMALLSERD